MATLNTLRTKFGIVLSAVIAFALLAFILSMGVEMGFSGNDPVVGKMAGEKVKYSDYIAEYNDVKSRTGIAESDEEQATTVANLTWQGLFSDRVLTPGFEDLGLKISNNERLGMISGNIQTQAFYSAFADQSTGAYSPMAVQQFLIQANGNPEAEAMWTMINEQASAERLTFKYISLVTAGSYVNSLELEQGVKSANNTYSGRWVKRSYSDMPDSLYNVSESEIRSYYNQHKSLYERKPSREINYVRFDIAPTKEDEQAIESSVRKMASEFAKAKEPRLYIRENRYGSIADNYQTQAQLATAEAEKLMSGAQYGPTKSGNSWRVAKVISKITAPDSIGIRHIVLPYTEQKLADSLVLALKGGADFSQMAAGYSVFDTRRNGGEIGVMAFSELTDDFALPLANKKDGDIVKIEVGDMIQIIQPYNQGKRVAQVKVAAIDYPIVPSQKTINDTHAAASNFVVAAKGASNKEAFQQAAKDASSVSRQVYLTQGQRNLSGLTNSREVARWAYGAKAGELSQIFKLNDSYVVARVNSINNATVSPLEDVTPGIKRQLAVDKKFAAIEAELEGMSFAQQSAQLKSDSGEFEDVAYDSYFISSVGVEPALIGAISVSEVGKANALVKGASGAFAFETTKISPVEEPQSVEAEKVRAEAAVKERAGQSAFMAIEKLAEVEDLRGEYI
ncbi:MAG: SurA N-terminal domain-containing protein [Rikenellaceae bacterium]